MKFNYKLILILFLVLFFPYLYFSIRVSKKIKEEDREIIKLINVGEQCLEIDSFKQEIECIKSIQQSQLKLIEGTNCRIGFINLGSRETITRNTACCYDRSRITEQTLQNYGFKVRHVFLTQVFNFGYLHLFLPLNSSNHAVTEVLTSKGWLGVDSNEPFILLDNNYKTNTYKEALGNGLINKLTNNPFYDTPLIYVAGLYSRNGKFFKPYFPYIPEIHFLDFFSNISKIKLVKVSN